jgi:hypothetical protein
MRTSQAISGSAIRARSVGRLAAAFGITAAVAMVWAAAATSFPPASQFKFCGSTTAHNHLADGAAYVSLQEGGTTCSTAKSVARASSGHHGHGYSSHGFACKAKYHHGDPLSGAVPTDDYICKHKQAAEIFFIYVPSG